MATLLSNLISKYDKNQALASDVIKLLASHHHSSIINKMQKNGSLPLWDAIKKGNPALVQDLLLLNPNVDLQDKSGITLIDMANKINNKDISRMLNEYKERSMGGGMGRGANGGGHGGANMPPGQTLGGKGAKGDGRRTTDNNGSSGMPYNQQQQGPNGGNFQMNQGWLGLIKAIRIPKG